MGGKRISQVEFIELAKQVHEDKYDYSQTTYQNKIARVKIICPTHGLFEQQANNHLLGYGCRKCGFIVRDKKKKKDTSWFIERSKEAHGETYDYSKAKYTKALNKITIICKVHGEFEQTAMSHMKGFGCEKCGYESLKESKSLGTEEFIRRAKKIHDNKYDYSLVDYNGKDIPVTIICPDHGKFLQAPNNHTKKKGPQGCPECSKEEKSVKMSMGTEEFIRRAKEVHKNYDYSMVEYVNARELITIICPDHGPFKQNPDNHLAKGVGCPVCGETSGEKQVRQILEKYNIQYVFQQYWDDCRHVNPLSFDLYLPGNNAVIEYQGKQHYEPIELFRGKEGFERQQIYDRIKKEYCESKGIRYIEISYEVEDIETYILNHLQLNK